MPPNYTWTVRGGSSKISCGEKHSMLMTAVLAARADGTKLPIMFIMKGQPNGRIESKEVPTFPAGHSYGVQEKAWMDARVWKQFLRSVLHDGIEECSVVLVDNFESHMSVKIVNEELGSHMCPLPPNSTSVCQPLDVGVMVPFKRHLRELWLFEEMIEGDDEDLYSLTAQQKRMAMMKRAVAARDLCSLLDVRQIFDTVIEDYPDADARLGRSAVIVKNPAFEDGVVKVLLGSEASLTSVEADAIKALRVSQASQGSEEGVAVPVFSLAERALKKNKVLRSPGVYKDCRFLRPTALHPTCASAFSRQRSWRLGIAVAV
ncbi:hypothetical protein DYB30_014109 [Aphanomyces astaci]|uniref:DDE-1 domain-containing protein n=1 Tax=Aphanomyces astaci TaxID=112090 RepID=A0A397DY81_APHAT|nr:hypothetical protein DYB30_014109 [Aphanomyces astaci]